jgi:hypothetical protein
MSKKSKLFLAMACIAMAVTMVSKFLPAHPFRDIGDFAIGLGAALMLGVLITWRDQRFPPA